MLKFFRIYITTILQYCIFSIYNATHFLNKSYFKSLIASLVFQYFYCITQSRIKVKCFHDCFFRELKMYKIDDFSKKLNDLQQIFSNIDHIKSMGFT